MGFDLTLLLVHQFSQVAVGGIKRTGYYGRQRFMQIAIA
jgi:hypothetical protein